VNAEDVTRLLAPPRTMEEGARKLVAAANEAGGKDNITVVLLRYVA
jgi:serine/threonine protein phosphatase PrpC